MAEEGLTFAEIVAIWGTSDPCDWNETGNGSGAGYPAYELRQAASSEGFSTEWDGWDNTEGVHR